jgi:hypothetical protein
VTQVLVVTLGTLGLPPSAGSEMHAVLVGYASGNFRAFSQARRHSVVEHAAQSTCSAVS